MEEVLEYELLNIEWELNYEFDLKPSCMCVRDGSGEPEQKESSTMSLRYDENGIPMGESPEETKQRKQIIFDFYEQWKSAHPEKAVYNESLKADILIRKESVVEAAGHAARSYKSTLAVMKLDELLAGAVKVGIDKPKPGNKNQSKLTSMILMTYQMEGIGKVKLTVGVRLRSGDKIQYGIFAVPDNLSVKAIVIDKEMKKASHKK